MKQVFHYISKTVNKIFDNKKDLDTFLAEQLHKGIYDYTVIPMWVRVYREKILKPTFKTSTIKSTRPRAARDGISGKAND